MGDIVEFPSNGSTAHGYLATPTGGRGPGVVVIQEWWGLVDHIRDVADRLAAEGFVSLVPDLYHGTKVSNTEPDEAGRLARALDIDRAAKDMSGAVDYLRERSTGDGVGVVGFCMGGGLALRLAALRPDAVKAAVPFYGPVPPVGPDWSRVTARVQGHYAEHDELAGPPAVAQLKRELGGHGVEVEIFLYPGTSHAFFNDTRPEVYDDDAARTSWARTVNFLRSTLT